MIDQAVNALGWWASLCAPAAGSGGLLLAVFLAGLFGSLTHCAGMCGPFVMSQAGARLGRIPAARLGSLSRLRGAALLPYHLGRMTTYALLGGSAAAVSGGLRDMTGFRWLSAALLLAAAMLFLGHALGRLGAALPRLRGLALPGWQRLVARASRPGLADPRGWRGYALGVTLGFLPCGLLYGAIAAAASTGSAATGALAMALFALGTMPVLIGVAGFGALFLRRFPQAARHAMAAVLLVNAGTLALSALAWAALS